MPIKQELLSFPICKAVASQGKSGRTATVAKKSSAENSHTDKVVEVGILISPANKADASHCDLNPGKTFRQQRTTGLTPAVPSTHPISYFETSVSPEGQRATVSNRHLCCPKKVTYERELSPKPASLSRHASRSLTPRKRTDSKVNKQRSTRQNESLAIYRETSATPRKHIIRANEGSDTDEKLSTMKKPLHRREFSPEISFTSHRCTGASSRSVTPNINSRSREGERGHETPSKRKILSPDAADCQSPSKRPVVVLERIPKECVDKLPGLVSPSLNCMTSPASPQSRQNSPLSPVQLCAPSKSVVSTKTLVPKMEKPPKSPTGRSPTIVPHTPDRLATHKNAESRSPPRSGVKRLNVNSPLKSPMKPLLLSSPRRSPRKFSDENAASPQKNLRKAAGSPLCLSSPSSLVSRLSVNSPSSCRKNLALSLSKPDVSVYRALRQSLSTGTPSVLVCREKQAGEIREFLTQHLTKGKPGSLYISGAPGTGKTASLISNLETLGAKRVKKVFLNCMTLKTAAAIYKAIAAELGLSVNSSERENRNAIEGKLTASRQPILLMLDEVDQLDSKNQEVLYTIFEWPALPSSSLVLVGIANSLDLTDRILPRLQARPYFRPKLLHFPPYSKAEIVHIINHRIKEAGIGDAQVIRPSAIQLLAGKVAAIAGDVRKALDVCRRAVELCEGQACRQAVLKPSNASLQKASNKPVKRAAPCLVEIPQILSIFNEVYGSRVVSAVTGAPESFPLQQKLLVCCLLLIFKYAHSKDVTLGKFHEVYTRVCKKQQVPGMDQTEFLSVCTLLESRGMFQVKRNKEVRSSKVLLLLNAKEAEVVLGDQHLLATVLEDRESLGKLCSQKN